MKAREIAAPLVAVAVLGLTAALLATRADGKSSPAHDGAPSSLPGVSPTPSPAAPRLLGQLEQFSLASPAIGRATPVLVYLPVSYGSHPHHRYPVLYLLHGSPGGALGLVRLGIPAIEDQLIAEHRMRPLILVMPQSVRGSEWANDPVPHAAWDTFVARDLVRAVDARFRTVASGNGRGIAGLSAGGYGALNIAIHHPGEFHVVESWSGYETAAPNIFRGIARLIADNSPAWEVRAVAPEIRAANTFFWFYVGTGDPLRRQNERFASELRSLKIASVFFEAIGQHNHLLWAAETPAALAAAAARLV